MLLEKRRVGQCVGIEQGQFDEKQTGFFCAGLVNGLGQGVVHDFQPLNGQSGRGGGVGEILYYF